MKMTITLGIGLQAVGILIEIAGLIFALRSFGSLEERWLHAVQNRSPFPDQYALRKEGSDLAKELWIIAFGLALQLIGLFA